MLLIMKVRNCEANQNESIGLQGLLFCSLCRVLLSQIISCSFCLWEANHSYCNTVVDLELFSKDKMLFGFDLELDLAVEIPLEFKDLLAFSLTRCSYTW
uniref:Citrate synthase n=1 Tax=Rhizophora mucronata TaxID=61149 RepID=A0A2P2JIK8_RHIMU